MLVPGPAAIALLVWVAVLASSRSSRSRPSWPRPVFRGLLSSIAFLEPFIYLDAVLRDCRGHRARETSRQCEPLMAGKRKPHRGQTHDQCLHRALHLLALGLWLGSAVFFNLLAAPTIFASFKKCRSEPSDRTAYVSINTGLDNAQKDQLGNALAGAAVGPIFPLLFGFHAVCGTIVLITALGWYKQPGKMNRWRVYLTGTALAMVAAGWPISRQVTELRLALLAGFGDRECSQGRFRDLAFSELGIELADCGVRLRGDDIGNALAGPN